MLARFEVHSVRSIKQGANVRDHLTHLFLRKLIRFQRSVMHVDYNVCNL